MLLKMLTAEELIKEGFSVERAFQIEAKYKMLQYLRKQRGETEHRDVKKEMLAQFGLVEFKRNENELVYDWLCNPYAEYEYAMGAPNGYLSDFNY